MNCSVAPIYTRKGVADVGEEVVLLLNKVDESDFPYEVFSVYSFLARGDEAADIIEKFLVIDSDVVEDMNALDDSVEDFSQEVDEQENGQV